MNEFINMEVRFFLTSALWGVILLVAYDCLRIFRKVINHGAVWISMEDIFYWMISAILIFRMMYEMNNGIIRGFSLLGILLGMIVYKYSISEMVVKGLSFVLIKIKKFLCKVIHILMKPMKFVLGKLKQFLLKLMTLLKKRIGILARFIKNKARSIWKALQTKRKRVRIEENQPMDVKKSKKSHKGRRKEARAS